MARARKSDRAPVRFWLISAIAAIVCLLMPLPAWMFEQFYSRVSFPPLQAVFTAASNQLPFAVLDALIAVVALLVLYRLARLVVVAKDRGVLAAISEGLRRVVRLASVAAVVFFVVWGFNYRRMPLEAATTPAAPGPVDSARLVAAFNDANVLAGRLRRSVQESQGLSFGATAEALRDPMNQALMQLNRPVLVTPGRVKHSIFVQPFFEKAGFDGMINPLALETIVHSGLLPFERPFVVAHEWAHLAGHADEAEASAVGWLACMKGGPDLAYSASLYLIMQTQAAMPADARRQALGRLHPGVREDLAAISERLQSEDPRVQRAAERVYDEYLKANRVEDGTASYGRALELILSKPFRDALSSYR